MSSTLLSKFLVASLLLFALATPAWGQSASAAIDNSGVDCLYESLSSAPITDYPLTLCTWFYLDSTTSGQVFMAYTDLSSSTNIVIGTWDSGGLKSVTTRDCSGQIHCWGDTTITTSEWHFQCGVIDSSGNVVDYLDGVDVSNGGDCTTGSCSWPGGRDSIGIGGTPQNNTQCQSNSLYGKIAHAHLYDRDLSFAETEKIRFCPGSVTKGLVGYWPLTGSGTAHYDYSGNGYTLDEYNSSTPTNSIATSSEGPPVSINCAGAGGN